MLSFMREQNNGEAESVNSSGNIQTEQTEQEYYTVSTQGRDLRKSTITLLILFGVGLVCLWFMIKKSTPQSASATETVSEQAQIEATITRLTGIKSEMYESMDELVNKFYEFSNVLQVPIDELLKNPFQLEAFLASLNDKVDNEPIFEIDSETVRREQLKQKAKDFVLVSIMQSDQGMCCMINNEILYPGDTLNGFEISVIDKNSVTLQSEGVEVPLYLVK